MGYDAVDPLTVEVGHSPTDRSLDDPGRLVGWESPLLSELRTPLRLKPVGWVGRTHCCARPP
jgi:hypothetical protein